MYSFPIWNQSVVPCPVLTIASWLGYLISQEAGQVVWYSHLFQSFPQFFVIHTVKVFGIVNKAEIDIFLESFCFFNDPADAGNLISGSSVFCKTTLNIWNFMVHILLKPGLENFEHYRKLRSCLAYCDPMDCSLPASSVHGILQAGILKWVPMPSFRKILYYLSHQTSPISVLSVIKIFPW